MILLEIRPQGFPITYHTSITSPSLVLANPPPPINDDEFEPIEDLIIFALNKDEDTQQKNENSEHDSSDSNSNNDSEEDNNDEFYVNLDADDNE